MAQLILPPLPEKCPYCSGRMSGDTCYYCGRSYKVTKNIVHESANFYILELDDDYGLSVKDLGKLYDVDSLQASIEKWTCIVDFRKENPGVPIRDGGANTCGLCLDNPVTCETCIVYKATGESFCGGTPYETGSAEEELEFLKGLIQN